MTFDIFDDIGKVIAASRVLKVPVAVEGAAPAGAAPIIPASPSASNHGTDDTASAVSDGENT